MRCHRIFQLYKVGFLQRFFFGPSQLTTLGWAWSFQLLEILMHLDVSTPRGYYEKNNKTSIPVSSASTKEDPAHAKPAWMDDHLYRTRHSPIHWCLLQNAD